MDERLKQLIAGCDTLPLHRSGAIQAHGALLCLSADGQRIRHASANLASLVGVPAESVIGMPAGCLPWLPEDMLAALEPEPGARRHLNAIAPHDSAESIDIELIRCEDAVLVELQPTPHGGAPLALYDRQRQLLQTPSDSASLLRHHHTLLETVQEITGFDRVMLYRFHDDWSGEVIAERASAGLGSYLGLHFPASDIPANARELYRLNPSRLIPDIRAPAVPLLGGEGEPPDLSRSGLRSVAPVHLQYLDHMGVAASFSLPIRVGGRLWGLVACHHRQPRHLGQAQRTACEGLAGSYSLVLGSYLAGQRLRNLDSAGRRVERLIESLSSHADPFDGLQQNAHVLLQIVDASACALVIGDEMALIGEGPDSDGIALLDDWFLHHHPEALLACDHLEALLPGQTQALMPACGVLAAKGPSERHGPVRLYWFRPAEPYTVVWAGHPNKPAEEDPSATMLSPRRSFEHWVETRNSYSTAWSNEQRMTAAKFRTALAQWL